jgi:hypothetical protein
MISDMVVKNLLDMVTLEPVMGTKLLMDSKHLADMDHHQVDQDMVTSEAMETLEVDTEELNTILEAVMEALNMISVVAMEELNMISEVAMEELSTISEVDMEELATTSGVDMEHQLDMTSGVDMELQDTKSQVTVAVTLWLVFLAMVMVALDLFLLKWLVDTSGKLELISPPTSSNQLKSFTMLDPSHCHNFKN